MTNNKNKLTEIVIATILIISIASSYKYYIVDKKGQNINVSINTTINTSIDTNKDTNKDTNIDNSIDGTKDNSLNSNSNDYMMKLEKVDFIKTQVVGMNQPLLLYGSQTKANFKSPDKFQFIFSNFRILDKLPAELKNEKFLSSENSFNTDGSMKKENTYIAKVDFQIINLNNKTAVTATGGFLCYHIDEQYEGIYSTTNPGIIFFESNRGKTTSDGLIGPKISAGGSYQDTIYFIIDKVSENNCNLVIEVDPFHLHYDTAKDGSRVTKYNNAYGLIKVNYSDIIWE